MASTIGQVGIYKTNSGYVPCVITDSYTLSGGTYTQKNNVAYSDTGVDNADLLLLGYQPVSLAKVAKTTAGTEGAVAYTQIASMATGTWGVVTG